MTPLARKLADRAIIWKRGESIAIGLCQKLKTPKEGGRRKRRWNKWM